MTGGGDDDGGPSTGRGGGIGGSTCSGTHSLHSYYEEAPISEHGDGVIDRGSGSGSGSGGNFDGGCGLPRAYDQEEEDEIAFLPGGPESVGVRPGGDSAGDEGEDEGGSVSVPPTVNGDEERPPARGKDSLLAASAAAPAMVDDGDGDVPDDGPAPSSSSCCRGRRKRSAPPRKGCGKNLALIGLAVVGMGGMAFGLCWYFLLYDSETKAAAGPYTESAPVPPKAPGEGEEPAPPPWPPWDEGAPCADVVIEVTTDDYGNETSWELSYDPVATEGDGDGGPPPLATIARKRTRPRRHPSPDATSARRRRMGSVRRRTDGGDAASRLRPALRVGPYPYLDPSDPTYVEGVSGRYSTVVCLPLGWYQLLVRDVGGDGFRGEGGYSIRFRDGRSIGNYGGEFGGEEVTEFEVTVSDIPSSLPSGQPSDLVGETPAPAADRLTGASDAAALTTTGPSASLGVLPSPVDVIISSETSSHPTSATGVPSSSAPALLAVLTPTASPDRSVVDLPPISYVTTATNSSNITFLDYATGNVTTPLAQNPQWFHTNDTAYQDIVVNGTNQDLDPYLHAGLFCMENNLRLCLYDCPDSPGSDPIHGGPSPTVDQWAPFLIDDEGSGATEGGSWVSVGTPPNYEEGAERTNDGRCQVWADSANGGDIEDAFGWDNREWILCCEKIAHEGGNGPQITGGNGMEPPARTESPNAAAGTDSSIFAMVDNQTSSTAPLPPAFLDNGTSFSSENWTGATLNNVSETSLSMFLLDNVSVISAP